MAKYPSKMGRALVVKHLFDAQFETDIALGPAGRGDLVVREPVPFARMRFAVLVLYAINQRFFLNEKNWFIENVNFRYARRIPSRGRAQPSARWEIRPPSRTVASYRMRAVVDELYRFCSEKVAGRAFVKVEVVGERISRSTQAAKTAPGAINFLGINRRVL